MEEFIEKRLKQKVNGNCIKVTVKLKDWKSKKIQQKKTFHLENQKTENNFFRENKMKRVMNE